jgi:hypothetical protein
MSPLPPLPSLNSPTLPGSFATPSTVLRGSKATRRESKSAPRRFATTRQSDTFLARIHARENINDPDHCASYLYCLAPCREKNRPDGICDYSRAALFKPDELGTHLREKNLNVERSAGVIRHVHLTQLEREGYQYIALEINRAARLGLGRRVPRTTRARPTDKGGKVFFATKEVEDLLAKYQDFQERQLEEKPLPQLQEQQMCRPPGSYQAYLEAGDDPESLFVSTPEHWWFKEEKELDDVGLMPPAQ